MNYVKSKHDNNTFAEANMLF